MAKKDDLGALINSMSKSEKRYFKLYAARHSKEDSNSLKLFEAVDSAGKYDSEIITNKFKGTKLVANLRVVKHQLHGLILKSMIAFHATSTHESVLREQLGFAEFLHRKGLYTQCWKILEKAKKQGIKRDSFLLLLQIISIQKDLIYKITDPSKFDDSMAELIKEENTLSNQLTNYNEYSKLIFNVFSAYSKDGIARNDEQQKVSKKLLTNNLLSSDKKPLSTKALDMYFFVKSACFLHVGELEKAYLNSKKRIALIKEYPFLGEEQPYALIETLRQHSYVCTGLKKYDEVKATISKIRNIDSIVREDDKYGIMLRVFAVSYGLELNLLRAKNEFNNAKKIALDVQKGLSNYRGMLNPFEEVGIVYGTSVVLFSGGHFHEALYWINKLLNEYKGKMRQDIYSFAKVLEIVIHYELKNDDLIEYIGKSTKRYLESRDKLYKAEEVFLKHMTGIVNNADRNKHIKLFNKFKKELKVVMENPYERKVLEYFNLLKWVKDKGNE